MNLRSLAEADNSIILEDSDAGYGEEITITDPASGTVYECVGQYHRIGVDFDPGTGLPIPGNKSAVTVRLSSIDNVIPRKGWRVSTTDITGATVNALVSYAMADRTAGRVTMVLGE